MLCEDLHHELLDIKEKIKLGRTLFGYYNRCFIANKVLSKHNFFIKFFKRRDKYRFLIKKKVVGINTVMRNLSSSVIKKLNGYDNIKLKIAHKEKTNFTPLDIVYKPTFDENVPIPYYFTSQIYLAYRSYLGQFKKGDENIIERSNKAIIAINFFAKSDDNMKKYLPVCFAKRGIKYAFDNGQIVNFQNNFKYLGDVPLTVCFDFETTTGNSAFSDPKMYVISYCQIYTFH